MESKVNRQVYLAAGIVMMLFAGIIYAWSILKAPLATEFGWDKAALGLNFTITMSCFCVGGILGGMITKKLSPRLTVILSAILVLIGFSISAGMQGNILVLYFSYGGLCGLGIGMAYNVIISAVTSWYPDKRGTASGAMMMGFGASSLVLGSIAGNLINTMGWRTTYFIMGVSLATVLGIGSFFIKTASADHIKLLTPNAKKSSAEEIKNYTTAEMVRRTSFWKFYILTILLSSIGSCVISFAKDVSLKVGVSESIAIMLVGVLSVCNGLGRIIMGSLFDRIGRRKTMLLANVVAIIAPVIMLLAVMNRSVSFLVIGLILIGIAYGSMPPISSSYTSSFYGTKNFALNFSIVNTTLFPASFSATIAGAMISATGTYISVFAMLFCFAVVGFLINLTINKA